jgi:hypothetical protein
MIAPLASLNSSYLSLCEQENQMPSTRWSKSDMVTYVEGREH